MVAVRSEPARREACGRAASSPREDTEAPRPALQHHKHKRYAATGHKVSTGGEKCGPGAGIREQSHRRHRQPAGPLHDARARVAVNSGPGGKRYPRIGLTRTGRARRAVRPCAAVHLEQIGGHMWSQWLKAGRGREKAHLCRRLQRPSALGVSPALRRRRWPRPAGRGARCSRQRASFAKRVRKSRFVSSLINAPHS
jgi:hypothetical protein